MGEKIAIIGIGLQLPSAESTEQFWSNLKSGRHSISQPSAKRKYDIESYIMHRMSFDDNTRISFRTGGYLEEIDKFDYHFFNMTLEEATLLHPAHRLFLQASWKAIEDAAYAGGQLNEQTAGVYIGYKGDSDYRDMCVSTEKFNPTHLILGSDPSMIAGRVAYAFNLKGPAVTVDSACSSSLLAIHLASQGLQNGDCEVALVGGVRIDVLPVMGEYDIGIESPDNKIRAFDRYANGTTAGEGVVAVLLKPMERALLDGDPIYAVISGTAVNQDGRSVRLTAPNLTSQIRLLNQAWRNAAIKPDSLSYIEAHGTGTNLGDPIELEAIKRAFEETTDKRGFCGIGSVKTNIGHNYEASGLTGLVKVALCIKNKMIPKSLNFTEPNVRFDFETSPLYVQNRGRMWNDVPRIAGVSSFGTSGTNCHLVAEEVMVPQPRPVIPAVQKHVFVLSAQSSISLHHLASKFIEMLSGAPSEIDLGDICYTLGVGRRHFKYRIALICESISDLLNNLNAFVSGDLKDYSRTFFVGSRNNRMKVAEASGKYPIKDILYQRTKKNLQRICRLYVGGNDISWGKFYSQKLNKVRLPTYQFEALRCWPEYKSVHDSSLALASIGMKITESIPQLIRLCLAHSVSTKYMVTLDKYQSDRIVELVKELKRLNSSSSGHDQGARALQILLIIFHIKQIDKSEQLDRMMEILKESGCIRLFFHYLAEMGVEDYDDY